MSRFRGLFMVLLGLLGGSTALMGCRTPPANSAETTGFSLVVQDQDAESGRFMRFELDGGGTLRVGSGREAQQEKANEIVVLDQRELDALVASIRSTGWFEDEAPRSAGMGPRRLEVSWRWGGEQGHFLELADGRAFSDPTDAVLDELTGLARRRFGGVLDGLPAGR